MDEYCLKNYLYYLVLNGRKHSQKKFNKDFIKSYDQDSNKGYT